LGGVIDGGIVFQRDGSASREAPLLCTVGKVRRIRVCREAIREL